MRWAVVDLEYMLGRGGAVGHWILARSITSQQALMAGEAPHHGLINRVGGLVREDAGGQAGDHPRHVDFMRSLQHVVIDPQVVSLERRAAAHLTASE